jgi:hypothetical protein
VPTLTVAWSATHRRRKIMFRYLIKHQGLAGAVLGIVGLLAVVAGLIPNTWYHM